jgi:hypothetical protein
VRSLLRPDREGVDLVLALRTPDGDAALHITDRHAEGVDPSTPADVTLTATVEDLAAALAPDRARRLVAEQRLRAEGPPAQLRRLADLFGAADATA